MLFNSSSRFHNQGNIQPINNPPSSAARDDRTRFFDFAPDYGDRLQNAENIGSIRRGRSYSYSGDVGDDDLDFFQFRLDQRDRIFATLTNESDGNQPIAMTLLNRGGRPVRNSGRFLFANVEAGESQTISATGLARGNVLSAA